MRQRRPPLLGCANTCSVISAGLTKEYAWTQIGLDAIDGQALIHPKANPLQSEPFAKHLKTSIPSLSQSHSARTSVSNVIVSWIKRGFGDELFPSAI